MMLRNSLLVVTLCAAACGPGAGTSTIPALPGDGDEHTAKPRAASDPGAGAADPWAGRDLIAPPGPMQPEPIELPAVKRFTLSNGLRVLAIERRDVPVISAQLALRVGRADASRDKMGIEQVVARVLAAGTKKRDAAALQAMLERVDARLSAQASYENTLVSCAVRSESTRTCLDAIVELVSAPAFPAAAVEAAQLELDRAALARQEDPAQLAAAHFQNELWGNDHVRGWPMSRATAAAISRADVVAWHKRYFTPKNAVLAIAGDFDTAKLKPQLENAFRGWRATSKVPARVAKAAPERERIAARLIDFPGEERAHIRIGQVGIRHDDPDFYAVSVLTELLGGGSGTSRLARRARDAAGATAGATAGFDRNVDAGIFVVSAVAPAKDAVAVIRGALQELDQVRKKAPPEPELRAVVTQMSGRYAIGFETVAQLANVLLAAELHGQDLQMVASYPVELGRVTPEQVRGAAEKLLDAETPAIVVVGDAKIIGPQLQAVGVVFETVGRQQPVGPWEREVTTPVTPQSEAQAKKILAAALKAKGGKVKLEGIKSLVLEGNAKGVIQDPRSGKQTFEAHVKRSYVSPDKMRRDLTRKVDGKDAVSGIVLAGNEAWAFERMGTQQGAGELPPELVAALETQMWRDQDLILLRYLEPGVTAALMPDQDIGGAPQHVVRLTRKDGVASVLYIDKKTKLLTRQSYSAEGSSASETYSDYKNVGGIQVPHRRLTTEGSTRFDMTVTKIQFNVTIPAEAFAKPKQ